MGSAPQGQRGARLFTHNSTATYFKVVSPNTRKEIRKLETQARVEREFHSNSKIMEDMSSWVPNPGHTKGKKKQYLNYVALH